MESEIYIAGKHYKQYKIANFS